MNGSESHLPRGTVPRQEKPGEPPAQVRALYDEFAESTYAFFLHKVRRPAVAADLNQELYLRLMRSLKSYRGECSRRTWIFIIARAVLADTRREYWRKLGDRKVSLDSYAMAADLAVDSDADQQALGVLLRQRLARCLRLLDDLARTVIIGHYFDGITLRELTERMGLDNASGSHAILISGQRKLRKCLMRRGGGDG